jgi:hypothetical protein
MVELPGGIVINAPHIANASGQHDKLTALDIGAQKKSPARLRRFCAMAGSTVSGIPPLFSPVRQCARCMGSTVTPAMVKRT